jgi:hypothetical protein
MTTRSFTPEDVDRLAAKLEAIGDQLDEDDRATLHAVFGWAGRAVAQESPEVSGFGLGADTGGGGLSASFVGGATHTGTMEIFNFSLGAANPTTIGSSSGAAGAGKVDLQPFTFDK